MANLVEDKCEHAEWLHFMACGACADDLRDRISALEADLAEARAKIEQMSNRLLFIEDREKMLTKTLSEERAKIEKLEDELVCRRTGLNSSQFQVEKLTAQLAEARAKIEKLREIMKYKAGQWGDESRLRSLRENLGDEEGE